MDKAAIKQLAAGLVAEVAAEWEDTPEVVKSQQGGAPIFIVTAHYESGPCSFHFNPQNAAEHIVEHEEFVSTTALKSKDIDMVMPLLRHGARQRITHMIARANVLFVDFLWMLPLMGDAMHSQTTLGPFSPEVKEGLALSILSMIEGRFRERLGLRDTPDDRLWEERDKKLGRKPVINDYTAIGAIDKLGGRPSRNQLAKELGVQPATILNWARDRGFDSLEALLDYLGERRK